MFFGGNNVVGVDAGVPTKYSTCSWSKLNPERVVKHSKLLYEPTKTPCRQFHRLKTRLHVVTCKVAVCIYSLDGRKSAVAIERSLVRVVDGTGSLSSQSYLGDNIWRVTLCSLNWDSNRAIGESLFYTRFLWNCEIRHDWWTHSVSDWRLCPSKAHVCTFSCEDCAERETDLSGVNLLILLMSWFGNLLWSAAGILHLVCGVWCFRCFLFFLVVLFAYFLLW